MIKGELGVQLVVKIIFIWIKSFSFELYFPIV